ncbi:GTP-binding protein Era [Paracholeplasma brassicae]|uniref:GTPase Era n=1 Tax=Acholeplasma brassicae TaxID=61635 RepID=U4KNA2_9MOLU|nr:GTPase Era [Paracholeplasma brassicae]CCV65735.1 GTP-binding protein Era [Paracholeplasma brassicae]HBT59851.1 GTPase Era [Acholeplasmataceae bacterium]
MTSNFKSGFVSIIGRPNVGKSTFLNAVIGKKVAITSPKPQTTRNRILGIKSKENYQMVFVDTPGIHKAQHELGRLLDKTAIASIRGMDIVLFMVDGPRSYAEDQIIKLFKDLDTPVYLVINKIDTLKSKIDIDKIILSYMDQYAFKGVLPISAKNQTHIDRLLDELAPQLPNGYPLFGNDEISDQSDFQIMAELIREKVLYKTQEEVPHAVAVVIEHAEMNGTLYEVHASIIVERNSQKQIIIGKNGQMLKEIGTEARIDINRVLETKIHLNLWVKVKKNWRNKVTDMRSFGYDDKTNL